MSKPETSNQTSSTDTPQLDERWMPIPIHDWIESAPESARLERILVAIRQVLIHIDLLHAKHAIHGCLTPDAISVWPATGEVRLNFEVDRKPADFVNGDSIEDACYLAPEQTGVLQRSPTPATDLYAIGLILYRLLTGKNPVKATNLNELLVRQMTWIPSSLRLQGLRIPRILDEMILRLVKRNPYDRYQTSEAVLHDIDSIFQVLESGRLHEGNAIGTTDTRERPADPSLIGRNSWIEGFLSRIESNISKNHRPSCARALGQAGEVPRGLPAECAVGSSTVGVSKWPAGPRLRSVQNEGKVLPSGPLLW